MTFPVSVFAWSASVVHLCASACGTNENQPKDHFVPLIFQLCFFFLFVIDAIRSDMLPIDEIDGITNGNWNDFKMLKIIGLYYFLRVLTITLGTPSFMNKKKSPHEKYLFLIETISLQIWGIPPSWHAKCSLLVSVRILKTLFSLY